MDVIEQKARELATADGHHPDKLVAGQPTWRLYVKKVTVDPTEPDCLSPEALALMAKIQSLCADRKRLSAEIDGQVRELAPMLAGKRVLNHDGAIYVLERYLNAWGDYISGRGRKVRKDGTFGSKSWEVRGIKPGSFKS